MVAVSASIVALATLTTQTHKLSLRSFARASLKLRQLFDRSIDNANVTEEKNPKYYFLSTQSEITRIIKCFQNRYSLIRVRHHIEGDFSVDSDTVGEFHL